MSALLTACGHLLRAFGIIYLCLYAGLSIAALLPFTLPGSIIGMLILLILLASQLIPVSWIKPASTLLIRYMTLLFVPISVGIMNYGPLLYDQFGPLVVSCMVSTLWVLVMTAWSMTWFQRKASAPKSEHE